MKNNNESNLGDVLSPEKLGQGVKAFRQLKNLPLKGVAELCSVSEQLIAALEQGEQVSASVTELLSVMQTVFPESFKSKDIDDYSIRYQRIDRQQSMLSELIGNAYIHEGDFKKSAEVILKAISQTLNIEYVGFWLYTENKQALKGVYAYSMSHGEDKVEDYFQADFPRYFKGLEGKRTFVADYSVTDSITDEFAKQEYEELGITGSLHSPVFSKNNQIGVVISDYVGEKRAWHTDEISFHAEVAGLLALAYLNAENKKLRDEQAKRQQVYQLAIYELSRYSPLIEGNIKVTIPYITAFIAKVLAVAVVDVWFVDDEQKNLIGQDEFRADLNKHIPLLDYSKEQLPQYFKALEEERVVVVNNVLDDVRVNEDAETFKKEGISSLLSVAVRVRGKMVAVISTEHIGDDREWLADEISFLSEVSEQMAQLIINYRAVEEEAQRKIELHRTFNFQSALDSLKYNELFNQEDYRKSLEEISRLLAEVIDVEYVGVYLFDLKKESLRGVALYQLSEKACVYAGNYSWSEADAYYDLLADMRILVCDDVVNDPRMESYEDLYKDFSVKALIEAGIFVDGEIVGTISIEHTDSTRQWTQEEVMLSRRVSEKVSEILAADNNRKKEKEFQQQLQREKIQNQAVLSLLTGQRLGGEDLQASLDYISKLTSEVLGVEFAGVYLFDEEKDLLSAASLFQLSVNAYYTSDDTYSIGDARDYYQELEKHRTLTSQDCLADDKLKDFSYLEADGIKSTADTVIRIHGKSVGVLNVEHTESREWFSDEIVFMGSVADHVAQVLLVDKMRQDTDAYASVAKRREELEHMVNNGQFVLIDWSDADGGVKFISDTIRQFGYMPDDFYSGNIVFSERVHTDDIAVVRRRFKEFERNVSANKMHIEFRFLSADGEVRWVEEHAQIVRDDLGEIDRYYMVFHDVTSRKQAEISLRESKEKMQKMAFYDALTGLENRELFKQQLEYAIRIAHRQEKTVALLYLDVDNFKMVNDTLGHDAGDTLLKIIADRLLDCVRETDSVARIGGDEFTVLLTEVKGKAGTKRAAEKLIESFTKPIKLYDQELIVSPSIGITLCPEDGTGSTLLMKNADLAMYQAKAMGRNNFQFFDESMNAEISKRVKLEAELRQALEERQFQLFFQPVIDLKSMKCVSVEALVRWFHPEKGMIPPDVFISTAEETGLIIPLGEQIFDLACQQVSLINQAGLCDIKVAVNLSARQFHDPNLIEVVKKHLANSQLQASQMILEVTESLLMDKVEDAIATLHELKDLGFSLSIDDFGTGYSSLSYLKRLPIDTVKVDRSFVRDIPEDISDMEITSAVIAMAHKLNLKVVAEGVEELEQQDFLAVNKCDYAQGYYYSKPVPAHELVGIIRKLSS